ncbi:helix-turn-helix domain-containing protein [Aeromicrobium sp. 636]|uniref:TOBE domain-containing protein n=1 Tax=Aeromicrobium senzhongii TaxID=2663859 RepID=A0A8I0K1L8_9ACTN|nr:MULTISPECIES: TOBE domain-containing protein [Aeromicrobium]MBC9224725.1 TOBE domain-containing protein [Aeromicrobium senzhongii]MCQ3996838.1 helix-turn-helix domain-containing protein [Aeromicrobium sp. 636]
MAQVRISDAADFLGVSTDTVRRLVAAGRLPADKDASGRTVVDGRALAEYVRAEGRSVTDPTAVRRSARNRFVGIVTEVISDRVMSQVELQCGPHRVVSLVSTESVRELGLEPGVVAVAVVKATNVALETPGGAP